MLVSWFITLRSSVAPLPLPTYHPCAIMRENTLKQRLYAGKAAFGVMYTFPSPTVVEMLGCLGFDWIPLPKFLGLGVRYFHGSVGRLLQQSSVAYLHTMRQAAVNAGK